jgi:hypothetical protein
MADEDPQHKQTKTATSGANASDAAAEGSRTGAVTMAAAEGALMLGETAAYNSLKTAADEIARWINSSAGLPSDSKVLMAEGDPLADSTDYALLTDHLAMLEADVANQQHVNAALLNPEQQETPASLEGKGPGVFAQSLELGALIGGAKAAVSMGTAVIQAAPALLSAVNTVMGYFRADYDIASTRTSATSEALRYMVADQIGDKVSVYFYTGAIVKESAVLRRAGALYVLAHKTLMAEREAIVRRIIAPTTVQVERAEKRVVQAKDGLKEVEARWHAQDALRIKALSEGKDPKPFAEDMEKQVERRDILNIELTGAQATLDTEQAKLKPALAAVEAIDTLIKQIGDFLKAIRDEGSHAPQLKAAMRHEWIQTTGIDYVLQVSVVSAGHETITEKGPIYKIAQMQMLYLVGSSVVSYLLTDLSGKKIKADTLARASTLRFALNSGLVTDIKGLKTA